MQVNLAPEWQQFVDEQLRKGRYVNASEVVSDALRVLRSQEDERKSALAEVRAKIAHGIEQIRRGEIVEGEKVFDEIRARSPEFRRAAS